MPAPVRSGRHRRSQITAGQDPNHRNSGFTTLTLTATVVIAIFDPPGVAGRESADSPHDTPA
jgi:hypothetical protein